MNYVAAGRMQYFAGVLHSFMQMRVQTLPEFASGNGYIKLLFHSP